MLSAIRRVAHVIAPAPAGGAESVVLALASAAADRSRVIVLNQVAHRDDPPHTLSDQLRSRDVVVDELRCGRRRYRAEVRAVSELIRRHDVEIVHTHGYHATVVGYLAARRAGVPAVATVHGYLSRNVKERFYNVVDRWLLRRFDAVIAVSQGIADQLAANGVSRERVVIVQNGLATSVSTLDRQHARQQLGLSAYDQVIGWVGRLSPEKGADLFLRGLEHSDPSVRAVVIGEGPELPGLERLVRELDLSERVAFTGFRPDAARFLQAFDVLALTSRIEGTPMIILEAVAAKVPIVAFAVGGLPQLLDNDSAWLIPPEDVSALRRALQEALGSPSERIQRADAARRRVAHQLSAEQWLERVWRVYDNAAQVSRAP
jgi:glycosyltransferase involved in cell wall biosynthesis